MTVLEKRTYMLRNNFSLKLLRSQQNCHPDRSVA